MMIVQQATPDGMQGRVNSLIYAGIQGGPRLGDAEAGGAAALGGPQFAAWSGGVLSVVTAVVTCWLLPGMWRYDSWARKPGPAGRGAEGRPEPDPVG
jgi:ENTS family enterobactin (siderophore) exporter